ncbi:hypothetical protein SDC9_169108 [bioreactor metagenome]|uniref:Uncharacterized protein n=1 Tax=bioreactor metagenome TaxID=1076179 RepID=A0A645G4F0_9ZZZZ
MADLAHNAELVRRLKPGEYIIHVHLCADGFRRGFRVPGEDCRVTDLLIEFFYGELRALANTVANVNRPGISAVNRNQHARVRIGGNAFLFQ